MSIEDGSALPDRLTAQPAVLAATDITRASILLPSLASENHVARFLDGFYTLATRCIEAEGGEVIKYLGDACLALFPEDAALAAIRAMQTLRGEFPGFCEAAGAKPTDIRCRVHHGNVIVGAWGPQGYRDMSGRDVGTLMRMEGPGITVSESIYRRLPSAERSPWKKRSAQVLYHLP